MKQTKLVVFWHPFPEKSVYSGSNLFLTGQSAEAGIIGVDLKDYRDLHAGRLLREADLTVIFLKHSPWILDSYFTYAPDHRERSLYCVYDYFSQSRPDQEQITLLYRIPRERLCVLPFNSRLEYAGTRGHLPSYLKQERRRHPYEQLIGFYPCLKEAREKMWNALGMKPAAPVLEAV